MRQQYDNQAIGRLLARIKTLDLAVKKEDHEKFESCCYESLRDMGEIMVQAGDHFRWHHDFERTGDKMINGRIGDFDYTIWGCCSADISLYNEKTGKQLDVQQYEDKYKIMFCDDTTATITDRVGTIRTIAYFLLTQRKNPSLRWIDDPEIAGWSEAEELGWC